MESMDITNRTYDTEYYSKHKVFVDANNKTLNSTEGKTEIPGYAKLLRLSLFKEGSDHQMITSLFVEKFNEVKNEKIDSRDTQVLEGRLKKMQFICENAINLRNYRNSHTWTSDMSWGLSTLISNIQKAESVLRDEISEIKEKEAKQKNIYLEILSTETGMLKIGTAIREIYLGFRQAHPDDQLLTYFVEKLESSLPIFQSFKESLEKIVTSDKSIAAKGAELLELYDSKLGHDYMDRMALMNAWYFPATHLSEKYAGTFETEAFSAFKRGSRGQELTLRTDYSPIQFVQRLPRHGLLLREYEKYLVDQEQKGKIDTIIQKLQTSGEETYDRYTESLPEVAQKLHLEGSQGWTFIE